MPRNADDGTRRPALTRLRWRIEAALYDASAAIVCRMAPRTRLAIGSALGDAFWALDAHHRRRAVDGITLAYGDALPPREARRLARRSMRHFTRMMVATAASARFREEQASGRIVVEGLEHLRVAFARGRGMLGFSGHFGHWELLRIALGHHGLPSVAVARPLQNPLLDRRLLNVRDLDGSGVFATRGAVAAALHHLRAGGFVTMLIDQRSERSGTPVPFFGRTAFAAGTLAVLALRTGAPIVPGHAVLEPDGTWHVLVEPEVPVSPTGDRRADVSRIMADCTAVLERWVRRHPEQWLWTHARLR